MRKFNATTAVSAKRAAVRLLRVGGLSVASLLFNFCADIEPFPAPNAYRSPASTEHEPKLIGEAPIHPTPAPQIYNEWLAELTSTEEVWPFKDRASFDELLNSSKLPLELKNELSQHFRNGRNWKERSDLYQVNRFAAPFALVGGSVFLPPPLRAQIPSVFLQSVYSQMATDLRAAPKWLVGKSNWQQMEEYLRTEKFSLEQQVEIKSSIVYLEGQYRIPVTQHTWQQMPVEVRKNWLNAEIAPTLTNTGLKVTLTINRHDDLRKIAEKYAGERDYRPIERLLRIQLRGGDSVKIPVEKLLHAFVRNMNESYASCHGPNCFNAGLNVNRAKGHRLELTTPDELLRMAYSQYRFVRPSESLQAGDLLGFHDRSGSLVHVASYVGDGITFTKNGYTRNHPYIFQSIETLKKIYAPDGVFGLTVFRIPKAPESVVSKNGRYDGPPVYYEHDPLQDYAGINFPTLSNQGEQLKSLRRLSKAWLSAKQIGELKQLREDVRFPEFRVDAQALISRYYLEAPVRPALIAIGFNPRGDAGTNQATLQEVVAHTKLTANETTAIRWIAKNYRATYEATLSKIDEKFNLNLSNSPHIGVTLLRNNSAAPPKSNLEACLVQ